MRKLLNSLFITSPDVYLTLNGENIVVKQEDERIGRVPLHNLEAIYTFGYSGASPALMGACAEKNIALVFLTKNGRFIARVIGESRGNVVLRKEQYRVSDSEEASAAIAKHFIIGKIFNNKWILERATRDYPLRIDTDLFKGVSKNLSDIVAQIRKVTDLELLRGYEGQAAILYNKVFDQMILQQRMTSFSREEIADLLWIMSMLCCLLPTRSWLVMLPLL